MTMSDCCKDEVKTPKSVSKADGVVDFGELRLQSYKTEDEIHIHDDKAGLKFVYKGKRQFQLGMDLFVKSQHLYDFGQVVVVYGDDGHNSDLMLRKLNFGWEMSLVDKKDLRTYDDVICDKVIAILDDFVQRI